MSSNLKHSSTEILYYFLSDIKEPSNVNDNGDISDETLEDTKSTDDTGNAAADDAPQFAALKDDKKEDRESIFDKDEDEDDEEYEEEGLTLNDPCFAIH